MKKSFPYMKVTSDVPTKGNSFSQTFHINFKTRKISCNLIRLSFQDADTLQRVVYMPAFDISGYGDTQEEAIEMLHFSLNEFFTHLTKLSRTQIISTLKANGWSQNWYKNRDFSKAYVDEDGQLQNFNAVEDKITVEAVAC